IATNYPNLINEDKDKLRTWRQLKNGKYVETNMSAQYSKLYCNRAISMADLSDDDWQVETDGG
ncbi:MAG: hypothetical protein PHS04_17995, partial [Tissierellia bacterium]|nr:hypothetical protein [Tissierellia bacterium]